MWVIHSNDDDLSPEDLALAYKQLLRVEEAWRTMKSTIEIRPVFHRNQDRIRSHVFLCVLSLLWSGSRSMSAGNLAVSPEGIAVDKDWSIFGASRNGVSDSPGSLHARNLLKTLKIDPLPSVLAVE